MPIARMRDRRERLDLLVLSDLDLLCTDNPVIFPLVKL
jgi:hypothetical protein